MLRQLACAALTLALSAGLAPAEDTKPGKEETVKGRIKKVDPSAHKIIVTFPAKADPEDREFDILGSTRFTFYSSSGKKEMKGKEAYSNVGLKEGAKVTVIADRTGKVLEFRIGTPPGEGKK